MPSLQIIQYILFLTTHELLKWNKWFLLCINRKIDQLFVKLKKTLEIQSTLESLSLSDIEDQKALEQINPKLYLAIVAKYFKVQKW